MDNYSRRPRAAAPTEQLEDTGILYDVPFVIEAEMGRVNKTLREILKITQGSLIELDRDEGTPIDLRINGKLVARGEVMEIDGNYAIRISELVYQ